MNPESPIAAPPPVPIISTNPKAAAQAAAAADAKNIVRRKLTGYVGFANLPNQWHRKSVRKGFNFNVMVVGMSSALRRVRHVLMGVDCR
jgi:septin 7